MAEASTERAYREAIYESYVSKKLSRDNIQYTPGGYEAQAVAIRSRVGRWLPADRAAPILDIGCGPGFFLYLLDKEGYTDVTGVDLSGEQLALAKANCPRAKLVHGDARELLAQNPGRFELVTGFDFIEHFGKDELFPLLELIAAALRPGGRLVLQTPNAESPWGLMHRYHDLTHELAFDPHSLGHALRMAGFADVEARECGPYVHGVKSLVRSVLWQGIRGALAAWNLVETGSVGSGVYTRVFTAAARKPTAGG